MRRFLIIVSLIWCSIVLPVCESGAQIPVFDIIKEGITKVITAVDLQVQRLQNEVIWLQNAQKVLENKMSELKLTEINDWVEKQRYLYEKYFDELWKVKLVLTYYHRVKEIIDQQVQLINEYKAAWGLFKSDKNFTGRELDYMLQVYEGIMAESIKNLDQLMLVVNAFTTQMSDAKRMEVINQVSDNMQTNLSDLRDFNNQNKVISLQRALEKGDIEMLKKLYRL